MKRPGIAYVRGEIFGDLRRVMNRLATVSLEDAGYSSACWIVPGTRFWNGYARFYEGGRLVRAHRFFYEALVGEIPEGLVIDHLCRNRACCNPAHLEPVTGLENTRRGLGAVRTPRDQCLRGHALTDENLLPPNRRGHRRCATCTRERDRARYHAKRKAAAQAGSPA